MLTIISNAGAISGRSSANDLIESANTTNDDDEREEKQCENQEELTSSTADESDHESDLDEDDAEGQSVPSPSLFNYNSYCLWIRLFVAGHFVDTLLAGTNLLGDWLTASSAMLLSTVDKSVARLLQHIAWHLAGLLNYLHPLVGKLEEELREEKDPLNLAYSGTFGLCMSGY